MDLQPEVGGVRFVLRKDDVEALRAKLASFAPEANWHIEPVYGAERTFVARPDASISGTRALWGVLADLESSASTNEESIIAELTVTLQMAIRRAQQTAQVPHNWVIEHTHTKDAWDAHFANEEKPGSGVTIAHPDSGILRHPSVTHALQDQHWRNWVANPEFGLAEPFADPNESADHHGLSTASVIVGSGINVGGHRFRGIAPGAKLIPLRVLDARTSNLCIAPIMHCADVRRLIKAFHHINNAATQPVDVVSMSLGAYERPGPDGEDPLQIEIQKAVKAGKIVVCAAGNLVGCVTFPARYPEVISVAGSTRDGKPWPLSSHDKHGRVDIAGPAQDVYRANYENGAWHIGTSWGTSYAAAITAGVAALWIARHGRTKLRDTYKGNGRYYLQEAFRMILHNAPHERHIAPRYGKRIIDTAAVLNYDLPLLKDVLAFEQTRPNPPLEQGDHNIIDDCLPKLLVTVILSLPQYTYAFKKRALKLLKEIIRNWKENVRPGQPQPVRAEVITRLVQAALDPGILQAGDKQEMVQRIRERIDMSQAADLAFAEI